jgi:hypothetical protein
VRNFTLRKGITVKLEHSGAFLQNGDEIDLLTSTRRFDPRSDQIWVCSFQIVRLRLPSCAEAAADLPVSGSTLRYSGGLHRSQARGLGL